MDDRYATGRYEVLRRLGAGGCGEVFLARDRVSNGLVALKRPLSSEIEPARLAAAEFASVAPLAHPGLARVLDFGEDDGTGRPFLVYEAVEGAPSQEVAPRASQAEILSWAAGVAETLDFLHQSGLCHGDLKPENVFITPSGSPKLINFGLARPPGRAGGGSAATVAPELLTGGVLDHEATCSAWARLCSSGSSVVTPLATRCPRGWSRSRAAFHFRPPRTCREICACSCAACCRPSPRSDRCPPETSSCD